MEKNVPSSRVFEQVAHVQFACRATSSSTGGRFFCGGAKPPITVQTPSLPANHGIIKPAPVVRWLSQSGFFEHCLCKTHVVEIPKACDKRKQQPDSLALVDHQRLITVTIVINHFFRRRLSASSGSKSIETVTAIESASTPPS